MHAMSQLIALYAAIEAVLRDAQVENKPLTMADLKATPSILKVAKSPAQIRDAVENLVRNGNATSEGERIHRKYQWLEGADPYTPSKRQIEAAKVAPGRVVNPMKDNVVTHAAAPAVSQEVELVVAGVTIIVSKNPATGRPRITIEG